MTRNKSEIRNLLVLSYITLIKLITFYPRENSDKILPSPRWITWKKKRATRTERTRTYIDFLQLRTIKNSEERFDYSEFDRRGKHENLCRVSI